MLAGFGTFAGAGRLDLARYRREGRAPDRAEDEQFDEQSDEAAQRWSGAATCGFDSRWDARQVWARTGRQGRASEGQFGYFPTSPACVRASQTEWKRRGRGGGGGKVEVG